MNSLRLDQYLVEKKIAPSRHKACELIASKVVFVDGVVISQKSYKVEKRMRVECSYRFPYVSRGGLKLQKALEEFHIVVQGLRCLDVGVSTGGFSECLLKKGASDVVGVDVGSRQLHKSLRSHSRLKCWERQDIRDLKVSIGEFDLIVMDVSFLSSLSVYPSLMKFMRDKTQFLNLFKPQFEIDPIHLNKKGIVKSHAKKIVEETLNQALFSLRALGFKHLSTRPSKTKGFKGNQEYFIYARFV